MSGELESNELMSQALDKAPHINSGLGEARDVVTTKVDNSDDKQGPLGQGKADEEGSRIAQSCPRKDELVA